MDFSQKMGQKRSLQMEWHTVAPIKWPKKWGNLGCFTPISGDTVDGRNPAPVDMVNIPLFTAFLYIPSGVGFLPSTVWTPTWHSQGPILHDIPPSLGPRPHEVPVAITKAAITSPCFAGQQSGCFGQKGSIWKKQETHATRIWWFFVVKPVRNHFKSSSLSSFYGKSPLFLRRVPGWQVIEFQPGGLFFKEESIPLGDLNSSTLAGLLGGCRQHGYFSVDGRINQTLKRSMTPVHPQSPPRNFKADLHDGVSADGRNKSNPETYPLTDVLQRTLRFGVLSAWGFDWFVHLLVSPRFSLFEPRGFRHVFFYSWWGKICNLRRIPF